MEEDASLQVFEDYDDDQVIRYANLNAIKRQMNTIGFKEGASEASEKHRQSGFEEGMKRGYFQGLEYGKWKGYAHAISLITESSERDKIKQVSNLLHQQNILMWTDEQLEAFQACANGTNNETELEQGIQHIKASLPTMF
jgi:flagellar biosynthesis/type III secretory pathway protein FliH